MTILCSVAGLMRRGAPKGGVRGTAFPGCDVVLRKEVRGTAFPGCDVVEGCGELRSRGVAGLMRSSIREPCLII